MTETADHFRALYGTDPLFVGEAPGRVNLIGEHTDYNGGFVLPTAIPQRTRVLIAPRADDDVRIATEGRIAGKNQAHYRLGQEEATHAWPDYVKGVTWHLRREGVAIRGFDALVASDVPIGAGLSSSAALLVATFRALRAAFGFAMDDVTVARRSQAVENSFVGARVGIMDQMAVALIGMGEALFLDTKELTFRKIPLPLTKMELFVINSGVHHSIAGGDYNTRRAQCEEACCLLGVKQLRDLGIDDLPRLDVLPDLLKRRARHVITENERVLEAVAALEAGDVRRLGELFVASHASMRDDYEVSVPEVDALVRIALEQKDEVYGARLTGGGFGGSIVGLAKPGAGARVAKRVAKAYFREIGRKATVLVPEMGAEGDASRERESGARVRDGDAIPGS